MDLHGVRVAVPLEHLRGEAGVHQQDVAGLDAIDLDRDLVVLTGSNLAWCHPVLYQRLAAAK